MTARAKLLIAVVAGVIATTVAGQGSPPAPDVPVATVKVENSRFDTSLRAWQRTSPASYSALTWAAPGAPGSTAGAAFLANSIVDVLGADARMEQCLTNAVAGQTYTGEMQWFAPSGQPLNNNGGFAYLELRFYSDAACAPLTLLNFSTPLTLFGPAGNGGWQWLTRQGVAPPGTRSVAVEIAHGRFGNQPAGASGFFVDTVSVFGSFGFAKGDFDGAAETDLVLRNTVTNEHRIWFLNDEVLSAEAAVSPAVPAPWQVVGVDDFNSDGRNDLLVWHPSNGWLDFWFMNGETRVGPPQPIGPADPGPAWKPSATADFNHDGKPDVVLRNPTTQALQIWTLDGHTHTGTIIPTPDRAADHNWEIVGAADLNGGGNTDFLWYNWSSGRIVYWLMNASVVRTLGAFTNPMAAGDANWKVLAMGDYGIGPSSTGTGLAGTQDLIWQNATSGRLVLWYMDRSGNRTAGLFVNPSEPPAPATNWTVAGPR